MSRRWRGALAAVVIGLALYAGHRAIAVVTGLEIFHIRQINVRGNHRLSNGEVLAMLESLRGRSVLVVDLAEWRESLLNSPWVADASLRRTLPSTVDVVILERAPLGIARINGLLYLVDDRGAVIDEYGPHYADLDLPIIDGLSSAPEEENSDVYRALLARRLLDALRVRNMASQVSQIDVSDSRNAVVLLEGDPTLIRLGNEPHRFTRTQFLLNEFPRAFAGADVLVLTDIYAAGEDPIAGVTLDTLADTVRRGFNGELRIVRALSDVPRELAVVAKPGDLIVLLGAGSIGSIAGSVLSALGGRS